MPLYVTQLRIPQQVFGMHLKYLPPSPHPTHSAQITPYGRGKWEILIELHVACHTSRRLVRSLWGPRSSSCILSMAPGMCKMLRMPLSIPVSFNAVTDSLCFFFVRTPLHFAPAFIFPARRRRPVQQNAASIFPISVSQKRQKCKDVSHYFALAQSR